MAIAGLDYKRVFGLRGETLGSIYHIDEEQILFPTGSNLVALHQDSKTQKFLHFNEEIVALGVSPNRKWLAVSESLKSPLCVIYDLLTFKKRKTLTLPASGIGAVSAAQKNQSLIYKFSHSTNLLVYLHVIFNRREISRYAGILAILTQTDGPDFYLHLWSWEKSKILVSTKTVASNAPNQVAYQALFNPNDNNQISVVGNGIFKLFRLVENNLKPSPPKLEQKNVLCHTWTLDDRVICGTAEGRVYVFESTGELKYEFLHATVVLNSNGLAPVTIPRAVHAVCAFSKGLMVAGAGSLVNLYERGDELTAGKDVFHKIRDFVIPKEVLTITKLSISPSEEKFICQSDDNQLYQAVISSENKLDEVALTILGDCLHSSSITSLDTCIRKPLVVTCSTDKSIKVWNYIEDRSELNKRFADDILSVSFHPSGLYILVGFHDKLQLMNVLIDDLRMFKEFQVKLVRESQFSNGGQYFAAVSTNVVYIYSTWNFELLGTLKGHTGKIKSIYWADDDSKIITAGGEGAVYEWNLRDMSNHQGIGIKRDYECVLKTCSYTSVCMSSDKKTVFAVGNDKSIKEICEGRIKREIPSDQILTQICLSNSGKVLVTGTENGNVRVMKYPFVNEDGSMTDLGSFQEHVAHTGAVTQLKMSFDDQFLFSTGEDGSLYIFRIYDKENSKKKEKDSVYADEILVTKSDLEEKNAVMNDLKTRADNLKMENDYQLRLKDVNFDEKIKQVTEKFIQEIEALKINATVLRNEKEKEEARHEEEMAETMKAHAKDLAEMENSQNTKLELEYKKIEGLERRTAEQQAAWELTMKESQAKKEKTLQELNAHFDIQLKEKQDELSTLKNEIRRQSEEYEEIYKETEEDADKELVEIRQRFEKRCRDEREAVLKLKTDNAIMKKKYNSLQAEIDKLKQEILKMNGEEKKMHLVIKSLEKDISGLKREINERDDTIQDKEKRIFDLKKKNQELEKFKFVLDYKIKELKKQIDPRENDIKSKTAQIEAMNVEMQNYAKAAKELELSIADLKLKKQSSEREILRESDQIKKGIALVKNFKIDLQELAENLQDPKLLKSSLRKLYQTYCRDYKPNESSERDVEQEYKKRREYLEGTINALQRNAVKDKAAHRQDNIKIMQENAVLISEINEIRKGLGAMGINHTVDNNLKK